MEMYQTNVATQIRTKGTPFRPESHTSAETV